MKWYLGITIAVINSIILGLILPLFTIGIVIQLAKDVETGTFHVLSDYAGIVLTLAGFTLVGAIFEHKSEPVQPIVKNLLLFSIEFFVSAFLLLFANTLLFLLNRLPSNFQLIWIITDAFIISVSVGLLILLDGFILLIKRLIRYYIDLNSSEIKHFRRRLKKLWKFVKDP